MASYTIYPKYRKILADLHTPVSIYNKLRDQFPNSLLLESADYHDRTDSKSYICIKPIAGFESKGLEYNIQYPQEDLKNYQAEKGSEVLDSFRKFSSDFKVVNSDLPHNSIGLWGFSSFESVQYMEDIKLDAPKTSIKNNPDLKYQLFQFILILDHFKNELFIVEAQIGDNNDSMDNINKVLGFLQVNNLPNFSFTTEQTEYSNISDDHYKTLVNKGIEHCKLGDTFQLVLSRAFFQKFKGDDFNLYRSLRNVNPSPYLFYFDYSNFKIFGSSPESQIQIADNVASINPIAGTILRGNNQEEDQKLAKQLSEDAKEMSEHVMLVDLARNDLSKSAKSVEVSSFAEVQFFSHVIHLVSKVKAELLEDYSPIEIFANCFPAGTLSGAPKYKALQLIANYESEPRNFYGGSIGFLGFDGSINQAIIIRSFLSKNNTLCYQAGAGIVKNSTPEGELDEVNNKVAALRLAIQNACEI